MQKKIRRFHCNWSRIIVNLGLLNKYFREPDVAYTTTCSIYLYVVWSQIKLIFYKRE